MHVHDRGYKRLFSNKRFFRQLLETFVNEPWVKEIDFEHSEKVDKTYISEHYKQTESDLLYQVRLKNQEAYVYVLIEFQSTVTWFMAVRILHYVSSFWLDYAESHPKSKKLPAIFPILLYSGDDKWTAKEELAGLLEQPDLFKTYTPQFRYCKIAENEYSKEQLLQIRNLVSTLFLAEMQFDIEEVKTELLNLLNKEEREAISLLLNWFKQLVIHGHRETIDYRALEQVYQSKEEAKTMLETAIERERQRFYQQGKAEGREEAKTMLETAIERERQRFFQQGRMEGRTEGEATGLVKGQTELLINLIEMRFGTLTENQKEWLRQLDSESLLKLSAKLWTAQTVQEIVG